MPLGPDISQRLLGARHTCAPRFRQLSLQRFNLCLRGHVRRLQLLQLVDPLFLELGLLLDVLHAERRESIEDQLADALRQVRDVLLDLRPTRQCEPRAGLPAFLLVPPLGFGTVNSHLLGHRLEMVVDAPGPR